MDRPGGRHLHPIHPRHPIHRAVLGEPFAEHQPVAASGRIHQLDELFSLGAALVRADFDFFPLEATREVGRDEDLEGQAGLGLEDTPGLGSFARLGCADDQEYYGAGDGSKRQQKTQ